MISLPTIDQDPFLVESLNNNAKAVELLQGMFPDLFVPLGYVLDLLHYLSETGVNPEVLPHVVRGVNNVLIGTGCGQVIVHIRDGQMNVETREQNKDLNTKI